MPTDAERIAALETRVAGQETWLKDIDNKLDKIMEAINMGKGAGWLLVKFGAFLIVVGGAFAWLWEHWPRK